MKNKLIIKLGLLSVFALMFAFTSCKNKKPSTLKVYVRSSNNELLNKAEVIVIADVNSDPPTKEYVDTVQTNSSGFAEFNMQPFFDQLGKKETTGYFDVIAKKGTSQGTGSIRCRAHITNVLTIITQP
ncbi:MAG TPA: hypothetical protein PLI97_09455 [Fluviicola sp.]|nr:hypothetical protein [Fluviicola sp.]